LRVLLLGTSFQLWVIIWVLFGIEIILIGSKFPKLTIRFPKTWVNGWEGWKFLTFHSRPQKGHWVKTPWF